MLNVQELVKKLQKLAITDPYIPVQIYDVKKKNSYPIDNITLMETKSGKITCILMSADIDDTNRILFDSEDVYVNEDLFQKHHDENKLNDDGENEFNKDDFVQIMRKVANNLAEHQKATDQIINALEQKVKPSTLIQYIQ